MAKKNIKSNIKLYNRLKQMVGKFVQALSLGKLVKKRTGRKLSISITNIITLGIFKQICCFSYEGIVFNP